VKDKTVRPDNEQGVKLSVEEHLEFAPKYQKLMETEVEVDIHPIELFDSSEEQKPKDPDHAIDVSKVQAHNQLLGPLIDVVLFGVV
jgi:hypothetical protein